MIEEVEIETFPHNTQLEVLHCILTLYHSFLFWLKMWLWSVLGWLILASFIAKAKAMSYFGIFKLSMLAPYKGYGKQGKKKKKPTCYHRSSITTWQSHLLAQPWLTYLPLSLRANNRQAPLLKVTLSDKLNQSVFGWGLGCHHIGWSFSEDSHELRETPDHSWKENTISILKEGTSCRNLIFQSLKFQPN